MNSNTSILIIGDVMLDQYVSGSVSRISPEAPVPVLKVEKEWSTLGGAANVAANVASLGAKAVLVGLVGDDSSSALIQQKCVEQKIEQHLVKSSQPTITKTRIVSGQQIVRVDREEQLVWSDAQLAELAANLESLILASDIVLLSDYAKGTLSDEVLSLVFDLAKRAEKRILVDPKREEWARYSGAYLVTPNMLELGMTKAGTGISNDDNQVVNACNSLRTEFKIENIVATRSSYGMTVVAEKGVLNIPTRALEVFDVSGAGDTVLAAFGVSLAQGKTASESAFVANAAAGIVVSKRGTAVVHQSELDKFIETDTKLVCRTGIERFITSVEGKKVVFANGCFDVLHQGHRQLLKQAKSLGDVLVIGLNSDASISRLKGANRPVNSVVQRVEVLSALPEVDAVIVFEEDTPLELLQELKPNVLVKGGDYQPNEVVGKDVVEEVVIIPLIEGVSTSILVEK
ncbi:D-glycero-beta-D-manno-heptose-7-phosphate kinase [Flavobacteriales bacterium]|nr:D-glycero-beta-D-manno-heptose-7-phosphate kinase [Flavobacteriales bacterium]